MWGQLIHGVRDIRNVYAHYCREQICITLCKVCLIWCPLSRKLPTKIRCRCRQELIFVIPIVSPNGYNLLKLMVNDGFIGLKDTGASVNISCYAIESKDNFRMTFFSPGSLLSRKMLFPMRTLKGCHKRLQCNQGQIVVLADILVAWPNEWMSTSLLHKTWKIIQHSNESTSSWALGVKSSCLDGHFTTTLGSSD